MLYTAGFVCVCVQYFDLTDHVQPRLCFFLMSRFHCPYMKVVCADTRLRLCIFIFLLIVVSMEICVCLVGAAQRPAERVGTVNKDPNTIYCVRCDLLSPRTEYHYGNLQQTHTVSLVWTQQLLLHTNVCDVA